MKELGNAVCLLVIALIALGIAYFTDEPTQMKVDNLIIKLAVVSCE